MRSGRCRGRRRRGTRATASAAPDNCRRHASTNGNGARASESGRTRRDDVTDSSVPTNLSSAGPPRRSRRRWARPSPPFGPREPAASASPSSQRSRRRGGARRVPRARGRQRRGSRRRSRKPTRPNRDASSRRAVGAESDARSGSEMAPTVRRETAPARRLRPAGIPRAETRAVLKLALHARQPRLEIAARARQRPDARGGWRQFPRLRPVILPRQVRRGARRRALPRDATRVAVEQHGLRGPRGAGESDAAAPRAYGCVARLLLGGARDPPLGGGRRPPPGLRGPPPPPPPRRCDGGAPRSPPRAPGGGAGVASALGPRRRSARAPRCSETR